MEETKIIAIANQKGGVGKTTSTINLACAKALQGKRVLMIDLDPQASLTISCGLNPDDIDFEEKNICNLLTGNENVLENIFCTGISDNLYIVPSNIELAVTEVKLAIGRSSDVQLRKKIQEIKMRFHFDYIFIDCPPQLGTLLINALAACDEVIIPVKTDYLSYKGLKALLDTIEDVRSGDGDRSLNPDLKFRGIIATMYEKIVNDHRAIIDILESENIEILGIVKKSSETYKYVFDGKPIIKQNKKSEVSEQYQMISDKL